MTKDRIKFYIDNMDTMTNEISKVIGDLEISEQSNLVDQVYNVLLNDGKDILKKYNLDKEVITILFSIQDKQTRDYFLGNEKGNQLLRDIIDIYGNDAYEILGGNWISMSDIDGILIGENKQQYEEFYKEVLTKKSESATTLGELSDILLSTRPDFVSPQIVSLYLNSEQSIDFNELVNFIENAPEIAVNGNIIKQLIQKTNNFFIDDKVEEFIGKMPQELFDEEFCKELIEKTTDKNSTYRILNVIPTQAKSREIFELSISKGCIFSLPKQNIFEDMTDEEFQKWCDTQILSTIDENTDIGHILINLDENKKSEEVCRFCAQKIGTEGAISVLRNIPEQKRTREIYEILLKKNYMVIGEIPYENFDKNITQKEYETWVDELIVNTIKETELGLRALKSISRGRIGDLDGIPRGKITPNVFRALKEVYEGLDETSRHELEGIPTEIVPIYNRTTEFYEDMSSNLEDEIYNIPCIDVDVEKIRIEKIREEYKKWQAKFSEEEKKDYRKWYEKIIVEQGLIQIDKLPREGWTLEMWKHCIDKLPKDIVTKLPVPENEREVKLFEQVVLYAISKSPQIIDNNRNFDLLSNIPQECLTEKVILEAVKKDPQYIKYADLESEEFEQLLQIGYRPKLETLGRTELTKQEIQLMKKFAKNNYTLFDTLNLSILNPDILSSVGEKNLEQIARYSYVQSRVIELAKDKDALAVFGFCLEELKEDSKFLMPLIEKLAIFIEKEENSVNLNKDELRKSLAKERYSRMTKGIEEQSDKEKKLSSYLKLIPEGKEEKTIKEAGEFLKIVSSRIKDTTKPLSEEERTIISYLVLNPDETKKIKNYEDILHFVENKNLELDEIMANPEETLIDIQNAYLQRSVGISYEEAVELVNTYGNDPEELLKKYKDNDLETYKGKSEKEALEIIIKIKSLISTKDVMKVRDAYQEAVAKEDNNTSYERLKISNLLDNTLRRAYGKDFVESLNNTKEDYMETIEHTEDGQEYAVRKINGQFNRMVSLMNAYRKSKVDGEMYDMWNTNKMAQNHALCYSFINESNPGTALIGDKSGIMISIKNFDEEAITAMAPYDLCSYFGDVNTYTGRPQKFYTVKNLLDQTRGRYSEVDVEIQDVSEDSLEYKKIQIESIICFEKIDEESIKAAIDLSKKLGKIVPIELIDRRELAKEQNEQIAQLFEEYKSGEKLQPELVEQIITLFNNVRNAHMSSSLSDELLGERKGHENEEAIFNKIHLNTMLSEIIEITKQRIENGAKEEGLNAIQQIKESIQKEREKYALFPSMYEKQLFAGIDVSIDQSIHEIEREYKEQEPFTEHQSTSMEILEGLENMSTITFDAIYGKNIEKPKQLTLEEIQPKIDFSKIKRAVGDVQRKGYYRQNKKYDEEHMARVITFSDVIASLEGADEHTRTLLMEVAKYYSCGRQLDVGETHEQYSAKIAGQELKGEYSPRDISIIQATIELQNFKPKIIDEIRTQYETREQYEKRKQEKEESLCEKYAIPKSDIPKIETMTRFISDAVELDGTRFVSKTTYNSPEEGFGEGDLKTETAEKLIRH